MTVIEGGKIEFAHFEKWHNLFACSPVKMGNSAISKARLKYSYFEFSRVTQSRIFIKFINTYEI